MAIVNLQVAREFQQALHLRTQRMEIESKLTALGAEADSAFELQQELAKGTSPAFARAAMAQIKKAANPPQAQKMTWSRVGKKFSSFPQEAQIATLRYRLRNLTLLEGEIMGGIKAKPQLFKELLQAVEEYTQQHKEVQVLKAKLGATACNLAVLEALISEQEAMLPEGNKVQTAKPKGEDLYQSLIKDIQGK